MSKLLLFDVDQTLLSTKGGDRKALDIAFHQLFGISDAFVGISFAGRMDMDILGETFRRWGIDRAEASDTMTRFQETYVRLLEEILPGWTEGHAYPGVRQLLEVLSRREDVYLGLNTGNFREAAFIKLKRYDLDQHFSEGGFGSDAPERSEALALAIQRCRAKNDSTYAKEDIYVIGDAIADIEAGKANGVHTVAVATGNLSKDELAFHNPTYLFGDLSDTQAFLDQVLYGPPGS